MSVCIFKVLDDLKRHKGQKVEENVWEEGDWWLVMQGEVNDEQGGNYG